MTYELKYPYGTVIWAKMKCASPLGRGIARSHCPLRSAVVPTLLFPATPLPLHRNGRELAGCLSPLALSSPSPPLPPTSYLLRLIRLLRTYLLPFPLCSISHVAGDGRSGVVQEQDLGPALRRGCRLRAFLLHRRRRHVPQVRRCGSPAALSALSPQRPPTRSLPIPKPTLHHTRLIGRVSPSGGAS